MTTASQIRRAREVAGLSQMETAHLAGIPLSSYQKYEQGSMQPPPDRLRAILAALEGVEDTGERRDREATAPVMAPPPQTGRFRVLLMGEPIFEIEFKTITHAPVDRDIELLHIETVGAPSPGEEGAGSSREVSLSTLTREEARAYIEDTSTDADEVVEKTKDF